MVFTGTSNAWCYYLFYTEILYLLRGLQFNNGLSIRLTGLPVIVMKLNQ